MIKTTVFTLLMCSMCFLALKCGEANGMEANSIVTEELCDILSKAAREESKRLGIDISFAIADEDGSLLYFKRMGDSIPISVKLVPNKAYTAAKVRTATENLISEVAQGGSLYAINTVDSQLVVISGGFPLFAQGKCVGAIGVGGGTWDQDIQIGKYVIKVFEQTIQQ